MRKVGYFAGVFLTVLLVGYSCSQSKSVAEVPADKVNSSQGPGSTKIETFGSASPESTEQAFNNNDLSGNIEWLDFETAIDKNKEKRKFIFIDIYTDWCGWCKKMDGSTFRNSEVAEFMNEHFYAVKMDAESKEAIAYREVLYETKPYGKRSYNELAVNLLGGKMSFPSFVILNKREVKRGVINGYQNPQQLISALERFID